MGNLLEDLGMVLGDFATFVAWKNFITSPVGSEKSEKARAYLTEKGLDPDRPPAHLVQQFGIILPAPPAETSPAPKPERKLKLVSSGE